MFFETVHFVKIYDVAAPISGNVVAISLSIHSLLAF